MTASSAEQRQLALAARRALSDAERMQKSELICDRVCSLQTFYASKTVGCYLPMHDEVDTRAIIQRAWRATKRVFVPVLRSGAQMVFCEITPETVLEQNRFGVYEPVRGVLIDARKLDVVVTPTVAFDDENNRIGMGSGYYDRCFSHLRHRTTWITPKLIGVAFDCQNIEKIIPSPWDIRLYRVVTER